MPESSSPVRAVGPSNLPNNLAVAVWAVGFLLLSGCSSGVTGGGSTPPPAVTVSVAGAPQTRLSATTQFTATVTGGTSSAVVWQVNQVAGGAAATGTISTSGLFTAPAILPSPNTVTISAVSAAASLPGTLAETILNPIPTVTSATATESGTTLTYKVDVHGSGFISGAQIEIAGSPVTTSFVSATEVDASTTLPAGSTSVAVSVVNPTSNHRPIELLRAS